LERLFQVPNLVLLLWTFVMFLKSFESLSG
jgi:hypothetical protein